MPDDRVNPEIENLKNQIEILKIDINNIKTSMNQQKLKMELGKFDLEEDEKFDWEKISHTDTYENVYKYQYFFPIRLKKNFIDKPEIFLSITAFDNLKTIWVRAEHITNKKFDICLETNHKLDRLVSNKEYFYGLEVSWLALGY